jgi:hypothetical protein
MNGGELRALQAPLKARYSAEPSAAIVTLKAQGRLGEGLSCRVETGQALVEAGLHPATGGDGLPALPYGQYQPPSVFRSVTGSLPPKATWTFEERWACQKMPRWA